MENLKTETRIFKGDSSSGGFDGYAGFRVGRTYQLRYLVQEDGEVQVVLDHAPGNGPLVVSAAEFKAWFVKA